MPEMPSTPAGYRRMGLIVMASSVVTATIAGLAYVGTLPMPEETRPLVAAALGAVTVFDILAGLWFFRKGQDS